MTRSEENRKLIEGFWVDLYRQDFAALGRASTRRASTPTS